MYACHTTQVGSVANSAGVGGGAIFIPILQVSLSLFLYQAVTLTQLHQLGWLRRDQDS
jgi:hypothetical protein